MAGLNACSGREYTEKHAWDEGTHVPITERPEERSWNDSVHKKIVDTVRQAKEQAEPAVVKAGKLRFRLASIVASRAQMGIPIWA